MFRGGPQASAQDKQTQQKQKKRLSFKDPEIEGPQQPQFYAGCRPKNPCRLIEERKASRSVENLSLETSKPRGETYAMSFLSLPSCLPSPNFRPRIKIFEYLIEGTQALSSGRLILPP
ncbi:hypothetical protein NPIL_537811 [Nephila pilipes]|uniref:Uncharacterized protein n=1 Tax=Nephila pilipes TaxID=299642 RepID=A0A8X6TT14_NEPPI|nr:hypothetical protein NPIL_537811 [Nephila pilipes]